MPRTATRSRRADRHEEPEEDYRDDSYGDEEEDEAPRRGRRAASRRGRDEAPSRGGRRSMPSRRAADDEEEDEAPRRGRRAASRRDDDEEDEAPRRSRRTGRGRDPEDYDEDEPRAARGSGRRDNADDEEDEAPRRGRGRAASRRSRDDDEDDAPRRSKGRGRRSAGAERGWNAYSKAKKRSSSYADTLTITDEQQLVIFLENEPFAVFQEHWIDELGKGERKSRTCIGEDECPLCEIGDDPRTRVCFNVASLEDPDNPTVVVLQTGVRFAETIGNFAKSKKTGPLDGPGKYWAISKSGSGKKTSYSLVPVKERDLVEDWDCDPLTDDLIDELAEQMTTAEKFVRYDPPEDLEELADQLAA